MSLSGEGLSEAICSAFDDVWENCDKDAVVDAEYCSSLRNQYFKVFGDVFCSYICDNVDVVLSWDGVYDGSRDPFIPPGKPVAPVSPKTLSLPEDIYSPGYVTGVFSGHDSFNFHSDFLKRLSELASNLAVSLPGFTINKINFSSSGRLQVDFSGFPSHQDQPPSRGDVMLYFCSQLVLSFKSNFLHSMGNTRGSYVGTVAMVSIS